MLSQRPIRAVLAPLALYLSRSPGKLLGAVFSLSALVAASLEANIARAEQLGEAPCADHLKRFVLKIDELLAKNIRNQEAYCEVIRLYLPRKDCNVEEAISISKRSRFFVWPNCQTKEDFTMVFKNATVTVSFGLQKWTGIIDFSCRGMEVPLIA